MSLREIFERVGLGTRHKRLHLGDLDPSKGYFSYFLSNLIQLFASFSDEPDSEFCCSLTLQDKNRSCRQW